MTKEISISQIFLQEIEQELADLKKQGLYKTEHPIYSPQSSKIQLDIDKSQDYLNFCSNNYLGLANNPKLKTVAKETIDKYGIGTASVRFICGTTAIHQELEKKLANFLGFEDVITYSSCFAANGAVFSTLLGEKDAIISADLNHASLIDGIRLSKAKRFFYKYNDMAELEQKLIESQSSRYRLIVTDGVFSMDGDIANLQEICKLAKQYNSLLMVDDSHATGFVGKTGRGTAEHCAVIDGVDILSGTLGKALGGGGGGFIASKHLIIDKLRNKSRPYLFSNNLLPMVVATSISAIDLIATSPELINKINENTNYFRQKMLSNNFDLRDPKATHPVVPVMLYDAVLASNFAKKMIEEHKIFVIAFAFPVVPMNEARIRVQISADHNFSDIDKAVEAFIAVRNELQNS